MKPKVARKLSEAISRQKGLQERQMDGKAQKLASFLHKSACSACLECKGRCVKITLYTQITRSEETYPNLIKSHMKTLC